MKLRKLWCKLFGHRSIAIVIGCSFMRSDYDEMAGSSTWGYFHCERCKEDRAFQYDA